MTSRRNVPTSYQQIAEKTVPELDVFRATKPIVPVTGRELEVRVRDVFRADPRLAQMSIEVGVRGSEVWLTGTVFGRGIAAYAKDIARRVDGVTEVHDELVVTPGL